MKRTVIVFDDARVHASLLPLTFTRPVGALRCGIDTIAEKWGRLLNAEIAFNPSEDYLRPLFGAGAEILEAADTLHVAGHVIPDPELAKAADALQPGEALYALTEEGEAPTLIARRGPVESSQKIYGEDDEEGVRAVTQLYHLFLMNGGTICSDFEALTAGRRSQALPEDNTVIGDAGLVFIEEGAEVHGCFINTTGGPVYFGKDSTAMEGSMLRGPLALCEHSTVNMGTKIYPDTTIGPWCKVGGEINNVIFQAYSNKAHDGFLGNAVIGEWCNLGAGCVASNLKNDYTPVKLWNYPSHRFLKTGLQFCGLIMGDHSKAGINTMFNTATVVGVGVNIHGAGFPRNFVASFTEGGHSGSDDVVMSRFFETARRVMARRHVELTPQMEQMLLAVREIAEQYK
ncbi:MAG: glucose-1-phosphate thymidylyltransferase [Muribaculaceae bacterium]|nr:glucose-1-phosphate thymidylyltransferase [Muribaculaceae bacterium]